MFFFIIFEVGGNSRLAVAMGTNSLGTQWPPGTGTHKLGSRCWPIWPPGTYFWVPGDHQVLIIWAPGGHMVLKLGLPSGHWEPKQ